MGAIWALELPAYFDKWGVRYTLVDGWETRSRSSGGWDVMHGIGVHHTGDGGPSASVASSLNWQYVTSPNEPIGNGLLDRTGLFHFGVAGASNTQGTGGPLYSSRGTIPLDVGNSRMFSIEAANDGLGETWPTVQIDAYILLCAAILDWINHETPGATVTPGDIWAHFEWAPGRKYDPAGNSPYASGGALWRMDEFRGDVLAAVLAGPGGAPVPPSPPGPVDTIPYQTWDTLRIGSSGQHVVEVQYVLIGKGYTLVGGADGDFGSYTDQAVKRYQEDKGLIVDGVVGKQTAGSMGLYSATEPAPPPPPAPPSPPPPPPPVPPPPPIEGDSVTDADIAKIAEAVRQLDLPGKVINFPTPVPGGGYADYWSLVVDTWSRVQALQAEVAKLRAELEGAVVKLSPHEIAWLFGNVQVTGIRAMTGAEVVTATAVVLAESGGDTDVLGFSPTTSKYYGNTDHGLSQISGWWNGPKLQAHRFRDPYDNVRMFKLIWKDAGYTFEPWNVTDTGAEQAWMMAAEVGARYPFQPVNPHTVGWRK